MRIYRGLPGERGRRGARLTGRRGGRPARRVGVGLLALGLLVLVSCGGDGGAGGPGTGPPGTPQPPADPSTVAMQDNFFNPASRTVAEGTRVTWVNQGAVPHNTVSNDDLWSSPILNPNATFEHTFDEAGTFEYVCTLHPGMNGTIVVE